MIGHMTEKFAKWEKHFAELLKEDEESLDSAWYSVEEETVNEEDYGGTGNWKPEKQ